MEPSASPDYIDSVQQGVLSVLSIARRNGAKLLAAAAAGAMVLSPAFATGTPAKKRSPAISLSLEPIAVFTPANADPKLAAALAGKPLPLTGFGFTPAPAKDRPSQVRVAIRAQGATPVETQVAAAAAPTTAVNALAPTTYNLGVAVGWRRFAVSGDVAKVSEANPALGGRESAIVGVSYSLSNKLSTRVAVGADRATGDSLPALRQGDKVSLDVGGSYSLSRRVALTGGVRYNRERDASPLRDDRRDSQAVYVGTAFKF